MRDITGGFTLLELIVLRLLSERPMYAQEVVHIFSDRTGALMRPGAGSIYPLLKNLTAKGLLTATQIGSRTFYTLETAGLERLEQLEAEWQQLSRMIKALLVNGPRNTDLEIPGSRELNPKSASLSA